MSNNKQIMKLYTEEEILSLLKIHLADEDQADSFVSLLTPIELLSDEEIEKWAEMQSLCEPTGAEKFGRIYGAKWMRDKIQGSGQ
jgi:hypothetical protein